MENTAEEILAKWKEDKPDSIGRKLTEHDCVINAMEEYAKRKSESNRISEEKLSEIFSKNMII